MVSRREIKNCNDIETLRKLCLIRGKQLAIISDILVDESKKDITTEYAINQIRDYLVNHQHDENIELGGK